MTSRNEVATLSQCRALNKRFGPPKNPAWWWWKGADGVWRCTPYIPAGLYEFQTILAWTLADLLDLCDRRGWRIYSIEPADGSVVYRMTTSPITPTLDLGPKLTAKALAAAILAATEQAEVNP